MAWRSCAVRNPANGLDCRSRVDRSSTDRSNPTVAVVEPPLRAAGDRVGWARCHRRWNQRLCRGCVASQILRCAIARTVAVSAIADRRSPHNLTCGCLAAGFARFRCPDGRLDAAVEAAAVDDQHSRYSRAIERPDSLGRSPNHDASARAPGIGHPAARHSSDGGVLAAGTGRPRRGPARPAADEGCHRDRGEKVVGRKAG